jgi:chromatin remodeling complex protein RSC6
MSITGKSVNKSTGKTSIVTNKLQEKHLEEELQIVEKTIDDFISKLKFETQMAVMQNEIKLAKEHFNTLHIQMKKLDAAYKHDIKKYSQRKHKRNTNYVATGFAKQVELPEYLAKFIGYDSGTLMSGPEITKQVWKQMKERGLTYENDKRVFRTNAEVSKLFNVPESVNNSTTYNDLENGFNFCNLQKYIAHAIGKNKVEKVEKVKDLVPKKVPKKLTK